MYILLVYERELSKDDYRRPLLIIITIIITFNNNNLIKNYKTLFINLKKIDYLQIPEYE